MLWDDNGILPLYCSRAMKGPTGLLKTNAAAQPYWIVYTLHD